MRGVSRSREPDRSLTAANEHPRKISLLFGQGSTEGIGLERRRKKKKKTWNRTAGAKGAGVDGTSEPTASPRQVPTKRSTVRGLVSRDSLCSTGQTTSDTIEGEGKHRKSVFDRMARGGGR